MNDQLDCVIKLLINDFVLSYIAFVFGIILITIILKKCILLEIIQKIITIFIIILVVVFVAKIKDLIQ